MPMRPSSTYVLVHGGCHGAWCWSETTAILGSHGVAAHALDLPGCGADPTPRESVTVADEVAAAVALIDSIPSGTVRLVGHSIGGWLLPAVAKARPERVADLVFLAAAVLTTGESGLSVTPQERQPGYFAMAAASPDNSLLPTFSDAWNRFFPSLPEARAQAVYQRLTPQPFGPYLEPATVGVDQVAVPRSYLLMSDDRTYPPPVAEAFAAAAGVAPIRLPGDHCVMITDPSLLAESLLDIS